MNPQKGVAISLQTLLRLECKFSHSILQIARRCGIFVSGPKFDNKKEEEKMRKAYVEIYHVSAGGKRERRVGYKFEEHSRVNIAKMLEGYTTDVLGKNPAVFNAGERIIFAFETDDGGNVTIYTGDLKEFQDKGLNGLMITKIIKDQLATVKLLL